MRRSPGVTSTTYVTHFVALSLMLLACAVAPLTPVAAQNIQASRPMTFLEGLTLASARSWTPSPNGQWLLYTVTTPDWEEAESQSDVHLVSTAEGLPSHLQMTFTKDSDEEAPAWAPDGSFFVFASDRDAPSGKEQDQLYVMRPNGGEARQITDAPEGVRDFRFSADGTWLVYRSGKTGDEALYALPLDGLFDAEPEELLAPEDGVQSWDWSGDGQRIYFLTPDSEDPDEKVRREKKFTVNIRNAVTPRWSLWALDLGADEPTRLTNDSSISVSSFVVSKDGRWVGFRGESAERYERNVTEENIYADIFVLEAATGTVERLTNNHEIGESMPSFSPDGRWVAFSAPNDMEKYSFSNRRVYLREVGDRGGSFQKLGDSFDGDVGVSFWSDDGNTIYFNAGLRVTTQLFALDVRANTVRQVTDERAALSVARDDDSGVLLINYQDPATPPTLFTVAEASRLGDRSRWTQLIDVNPQIAELALGVEEEVTWISTDGREVGGVLVKPVGYVEGQRYPLIVAIHGGPASADVLRFNGGYGAQAYAGAGYAVLKPNYRGSTNYGEAHQTDIVGDYFRLGYDDIMTGVDYLIAEGIVDENQMGVLGWSAGGHWSNWILTHTDRFKAISSGAGTMNWISMYAQSDVQRNRQFYLGDELMYGDFEPYWEQSPLKYIENAKTPTMVHVVEGDPRVPSPQSVELHMALKKLGVETELFMYPGQTHGIPDIRNRLVKSVSEMGWMDYYVRGIGEKFKWRDVLVTLEEKPRAVS